MLSMMLKLRGLTPACACNGQEAVEMVSADMDAYDLIFMDGLMPVMVRYVLFRSMLIGWSQS